MVANETRGRNLITKVFPSNSISYPILVKQIHQSRLMNREVKYGKFSKYENSKVMPFMMPSL